MSTRMYPCFICLLYFSLCPIYRWSRHFYIISFVDAAVLTHTFVALGLGLQRPGWVLNIQVKIQEATFSRIAQYWCLHIASWHVRTPASPNPNPFRLCRWDRIRFGPPYSQWQTYNTVEERTSCTCRRNHFAQQCLDFSSQTDKPTTPQT